MQETNGNGNAAVLIHNGTLDCRNTGIAGQVSLRDRHGVVDNHTTVMQKAFDNIDRMTGRVEVFFGFDHSAVRVGQYNIIPCVDIDFIDVGCAEIGCQNRIFDHFGVETVDQFFIGEAVHQVAVVQHEFFNIRLELIMFVLVRECGGIVF